MQSVLVLGRQPELGLAEVESLYGSAAVLRAGDQAAIVDIDPCLLAFDRLGGARKFAKLLTILETVSWKEIERFLIKVSPAQLETMPEGKMHLGISSYGFNETVGQIEATGLTLKKVLRKTGRSVRLVPNKATELNAAQVIHNKLTSPNGWELLFIRDGERTIVAQTVKVQDIDAYARRDRARPQRDTRVGMLPPKLAQIIINLSVGQLSESELSSICAIPAGEPIPYRLLNQTILDPFCGTGVLLQEAALMGYNVAGTDLEPRMISYSQKNLDWLHEQYQLPGLNSSLEVGDATDFQWLIQPDFVAAETYLGRPFTAQPSAEILNQTVSECNLIIKKFLRNIGEQLAPGTRLCLAVPAWQTKLGQIKRLPLVDQLANLGYNQVSFEQIGSKPLIYARSDQIVARELLVIIRK